MGTERAVTAMKKMMSVLEKYKFILLVLLAGLLLLLLPFPEGTREECDIEVSRESTQIGFSLPELEEKL